MKKGWSESSTISANPVLGLRPVICKPAFFQHGDVGVVQFVPVAVPLLDGEFSVHLVSQRPPCDFALVRSQTHGVCHTGLLFFLFHQIYDGKTRLRHYLCAFRSPVCRLRFWQIPTRPFACPGKCPGRERGALWRILHANILPSTPREPKPGATNDAFHTGQFLFDVLFAQVFTLYGKYFYAGAVGRSGVDERLQNAICRHLAIPRICPRALCSLLAWGC